MHYTYPNTGCIDILDVETMTDQRFLHRDIYSLTLYNEYIYMYVYNISEEFEEKTF